MAPSPEMAAVADQLVDPARAQFGPWPLPYSDDVRWMIRHHLLALSDFFPAFRAAFSPFVHNDGRSAVLLHVRGPVPASGPLAASIPISVWLVEAYPKGPPSVYLSPAPGTAVTDKHPFIDPSGAVSSHYILSWTFPNSNLVDLVRDTSVLFAVHPPLIAPHDPKADLVARILRAVRRDLDEGNADADRLLTAQAEMRRRREALEGAIGGLMGAIGQAEEQLQAAATNADVMEGWVRDRKRRDGVLGGGIDADEVFEVGDEPSRRLVENVAADMAAEDVMYALDRALRERRVPLDGYLRSVRELAREQFFFRFESRRVRKAREAAAQPGVWSFPAGVAS